MISQSDPGWKSFILLNSSECVCCCCWPARPSQARPRLKLLVMLVNDKYWHFYCYISDLTMLLLHCRLLGLTTTIYNICIITEQYTTHSLHFLSTIISLVTFPGNARQGETSKLNSLPFNKSTKPLFATNDLNACLRLALRGTVEMSRLVRIECVSWPAG